MAERVSADPPAPNLPLRRAPAALAGLCVVTTIAVWLTVSPATAILVLAAGVLLAVIGLLWTSIRVLSGEAELAPELAMLDGQASVDALSARKQMLLRALKDLEGERALGKLEEDDYLPLAGQYREELKVVLRGIDAAIAPHRARAEALAQAHLEQAGLEQAPTPPADNAPADKVVGRQTCPNCGASNEVDAKFCKECATPLAALAPTSPAREVVDEER